ncbi:unnamed protein product [Protopolystoma xenopodis]|uniref:Uncharacterized protein n=1 Tax=Protopolystoma xenopodis TaxID=117903 RepID=A0A3S5CN24_9PLAT|nr:unnamed protein product [Protopolystoma xenopodis]
MSSIRGSIRSSVNWPRSRSSQAYEGASRSGRHSNCLVRREAGERSCSLPKLTECVESDFNLGLDRTHPPMQSWQPI